MLMMWLLLLLLSWRRGEARCRKTKSGQGYPLTIGLLSASINDLQKHKPIQQKLKLSGDVAECFQPPHYLNLLINDTLKMPQHGWTYITPGIHQALITQAADDGVLPNLIIGPFYTNLAMMLQKMEIPYLVTDYKGFDWIDMNRVQDRVNWKTMVEIRPSAQSQNLAVVDLFLHRNWKSAMMVMPESAADNQECQNLAEQMLNHSLSVIPYTVQPQSVILSNSLQELLKNAQLYSQRQILICSPRDARDKLIEAVLVQARRFGILQKDEFAFILVDPSSVLAPLSGARNMYRLGLFSARCKLLAFRYVIPTNDDTSDSDETDAAASDAARVTSYALSKYLSAQTTMRDDFSAQKFLEALRSVKLSDGCTGNIEFDSIGQRTNYTLFLFNHGGEDMYKMEAKWNPNLPSADLRLNMTTGERIEQTLSQMGIFPKLVDIVVVEERPFVMRKPDYVGNDTNEKYEGFTIDLIKRLSVDMNFDFRIYQSPNNRYGVADDNNNWDGMIGEIRAGNATLAFGAISITSSREAVIDFSLGVISTGVNLLIRKPKENWTIFQFMLPFSLELWMAILGASASVSLVFFVLDYGSVDRRFTIKETIWFTIGTLLKRGSDFAPVAISQRILTAGFLFFVLITVSTYTANMAAFLTTKILKFPYGAAQTQLEYFFFFVIGSYAQIMIWDASMNCNVNRRSSKVPQKLVMDAFSLKPCIFSQNFGETVDSFEALSKSETLGVSTVRNSATMAFLKSSSNPLYRRLWVKAEKSRGLVDNAMHGLNKTKEGHHAFIFDYLINEAAENADCDVMTAASPILLQEHGIGMKAGATFKSAINIALLKLKEEGFMSRLKKKWWDDKRQCDVGSDSQRTAQIQFALEHTAGVFIVGLFGVGVAAFLFLGKKVYFLILVSYQKRRRHNETRRRLEQGSHENTANDDVKKEKLRLYVGDKGEAV